jgi:Na+-translocating ferredoxin:NAD+ oxidoreductase RnfD subunit
MTQTSDWYRESRDVWNDCNHRQEFEHDLINRQASWSLTGQTILFAAYGLSLRSDFVDKSNEFRKAIAISGFAIAVVIFIGVLALINSKRILWKDYKHLYSAEEVRSPRPANKRPHQWGVRTVNTLFTLVPDVCLPAIFALAWLFLLRRS